MRDIYEVTNQLGGYVDPSTPEHLANFLLREAFEAEKLAHEIIRLKNLLEAIDIKAEAGLCYFTLDSARAYLQDIRALIKGDV